ncbi:MAG: GTPase Era, partial [Clostridia bacterium]|nr:GTPase Era [Clostridia bacterium]
MTRTGFIAIVGRPNVGKSTLLNHILGEKVAIVSKRPQTTRNRITGIHTVGEDQYVFLDTPGIHNPRTKLGDFMVKSANSALGEADAVILVVEPRESVGDIEAALIERIKSMGVGSILVVNKIDAVTPANVAKTIAAYSEAHTFDAVVPMVAKNGKNVSVLMDECQKYLSESPWFFPDDIVTDQPERQIVAEIIREKLLRLLSEEIP